LGDTDGLTGPDEYSLCISQGVTNRSERGVGQLWSMYLLY